MFGGETGYKAYFNYFSSLLNCLDIENREETTEKSFTLELQRNSLKGR